MKYGKPLQVQEIKAAGDTWEVSGYLSTYGNVDLGFDVVMPGAFDAWLASGQKTRFLYSHRPDQVLGTWQELKSDKTGLWGRARISKTTLGTDVHQLLLDGALDSFSIGYIATEHEYDGDVRLLKSLELPEASLVAMPMNPAAVVTAVKEWAEALETLPAQDAPTLAERMAAAGEELAQLISDTRAVVQAGPGALNQKKRAEIENLLETLSGLDAVRAELAQVLQPPTQGPAVIRPVEQWQLRHRLSELIAELGD